MNRSSVFSDNDIEGFYDRLTQENSICLGMLKEVNEDSKNSFRTARRPPPFLPSSSFLARFL
jgi:hypothetical protein